MLVRSAHQNWVCGCSLVYVVESDCVDNFPEMHNFFFKTRNLREFEKKIPRMGNFSRPEIPGNYRMSTLVAERSIAKDYQDIEEEFVRINTKNGSNRTTTILTDPKL